MAMKLSEISQRVSGGFGAIWAGMFGLSAPGPQNSDPQFIQGDTRAEGGYYPMFEGPVFTPGTGNYFMLPANDLPVDMFTGHGFPYSRQLRPIPEPPIISQQAVVAGGVGGLIQGQMLMDPLTFPAPEQGG